MASDLGLAVFHPGTAVCFQVNSGAFALAFASRSARRCSRSASARVPLRAMFTMTPISASRTDQTGVRRKRKRADCMPVLGRVLVTTANVAEHLPCDLGHNADAHHRAVEVCCLECDPHPLQQKQHEQQDRPSAHPKSPAPCTTLKIKSVGALRQPELFFNAVAQPQPGQARRNQWHTGFAGFWSVILLRSWVHPSKRLCR